MFKGLSIPDTQPARADRQERHDTSKDVFDPSQMKTRRLYDVTGIAAVGPFQTTAHRLHDVTGIAAATLSQMRTHRLHVTAVDPSHHPHDVTGTTAATLSQTTAHRLHAAATTTLPLRPLLVPSTRHPCSARSTMEP